MHKIAPTARKKEVRDRIVGKAAVSHVRLTLKP